MKGSISTTTSIYHTRLPNQWKLERMFSGELSREAKMRLKWIDFYKKHGDARLTCRHFGISPTTFYKWLKRFTNRGLRGLENLSRAPMRRRTSTLPRQTVDLIISLREEYPAWSKHKIAVILGRDYGIELSPSTVGRVLKRKGFYDVAKSKKRQRAAKRKREKLRAARWMRDAFPGSLIQIDTKYLSFCGHRYYQFTGIDCFSRMSFSKVFSSNSSKNAQGFLCDLLDYFPFPPVAIQTDNGSEYMGNFDKALEERGITHYFSHPGCPKENSRAERKIQTTASELWSYRVGYDIKEINEIIEEWNETYNDIRPHQSLGYLTPNEFFKSWYASSKHKEHVSTM